MLVDDNPNCTDIDECTTETHECPLKSTCDNNDGGFECICDPGYQKNVDDKCIGMYKMNDGNINYKMV